jgi:hypothetical protein
MVNREEYIEKIKKSRWDSNVKVIAGIRKLNGNPRLFNCRDENEPWLLEL